MAWIVLIHLPLDNPNLSVKILQWFCMVLDYRFYKTNSLPANDSVWNLSRSVRLARAEFYVIDMHTQEFNQ